MAARACNGCGAIVTGDSCQRCGRRRPRLSGSRGPWSPGRNRSAQRRFRKAVLERAGNRCEDCGISEGELRERGQTLRATHLVAHVDGGSFDPANGKARCPRCDRASDAYAR